MISRNGWIQILIPTKNTCIGGSILKLSKIMTLMVAFDGDIIWEKDTRYADYYLAPNGTLFCFTIDDRVLGIDAKGKTMWSTKDIPQNKSLEGAFFDT
jgi:hypothetical protein